MSFYLEEDDRTIAYEIERIIRDSGQEAPAFLSGSVSPSDYGLGEGDDDEQQQHIQQQEVVNNGDYRSNFAASVPQNQQDTRRSNQPTPQPTLVSAVDDGWD